MIEWLCNAKLAIHFMSCALTLSILTFIEMDGIAASDPGQPSRGREIDACGLLPWRLTIEPSDRSLFVPCGCILKGEKYVSLKCRRGEYVPAAYLN